MALLSLEKKRLAAQSAISLRFNTYSTLEILRCFSANNSFRIRTYRQRPRKSFRMRTYKNRGEGWVQQMNVDWVRELCMSFPHATEKISWGHDLTFRVNEKIFAVTVLEPAPVWLCFKCTPETFADLTERMGIVPAPYMARAKWVALETKEALATDELTRLLRESYDLVFAKLPKKTQEALAHGRTREKRDRTGAGPAKPAEKKKLAANSRGKKAKRRKNV